MRIAGLVKKAIGVFVLLGLFRGYTDTFDDTLTAFFDIVRINAAQISLEEGKSVKVPLANLEIIT